MVDFAGFDVLDNVNRTKVIFDPTAQDPHTVTAYVSPTTGRAYGVVVGDGDQEIVGNHIQRNTVAVVDLQLALSAPAFRERTPSTRTSTW